MFDNLFLHSLYTIILIYILVPPIISVSLLGISLTVDSTNSRPSQLTTAPTKTMAKRESSTYYKPCSYFRMVTILSDALFSPIHYRKIISNGSGSKAPICIAAQKKY